MILALWVAWLASWVVAAFWSNRTEKGSGIVAEIAFRTVFWASATLLLAPFSYSRYYAQVRFWHLNAALEWILVALTATGFLFVWWAHSPGASLVGLADKKGWSPCRRYRPLSPRAPSHVFGPHLCRLRNRHRERNFLRAVWGRYFNLRLLHKSATRGTLLAGRTRRRRL